MTNKNLPGAIVIEGHIQGLSIVRSLAELGIPIIVIDRTSCIAKYSKYCHRFFYCPNYDSDEFAFFLINLAKKELLKGWVLFPSNDHAVYSVSKFKKELDLLLDKFKSVSLEK